MSQKLIANTTYVFDNLAGAASLDFLVPFDNNFVVDYDEWYKHSQLQVETQVFFSITSDPLVAKPNTERFLNPTQSQFGHWAATNQDFVLSDGRIKYNKQAHVFVSPIVLLQGTRPTLPVVTSRTTNSQVDHAQNTTEALVCVSLLPTPAPILTGEAQLLESALCMAVYKGQEEYVTIDPYPSAALSSLRLDLSLSGLPDAMQGVLWVGHRLEVGVITSYYTASNTSVLDPGRTPILGRPLFAAPTKGCILGQPVPPDPTCPDGYYSFYDFTGYHQTIVCGNPYD